MYCMSGLDRIYPLYHCHSLWGSRSVSVEVQGSVEILRMKQLPRETSQIFHNSSYWLHLNSPSGSIARDVVHVAAEPVYLCARSNDWREPAPNASISLRFRPAYTRARDREVSARKMFFQAVLLLGMSVSWLCPYLKASWIAYFAYSRGLNVFILVACLSACTLLLTPFILTRRNRDRVRESYRLYFSSLRPAELELDYRRAWLLFHALYFSSLIVCGGCCVTYVSYSYLGFDREIRNNCLRATLALAASALIFFTSRVFETASYRLAWVALVLSTASSVRDDVNRDSRDEVVVAVLVNAFAVQWVVHRVLRLSLVERAGEMFDNEMRSLTKGSLWQMITGKLRATGRWRGSKRRPSLSRPLSTEITHIPSPTHSEPATTIAAVKDAISASNGNLEAKVLSVNATVQLVGPLDVDGESMLWIPAPPAPVCTAFKALASAVGSLNSACLFTTSTESPHLQRGFGALVCDVRLRLTCGESVERLLIALCSKEELDLLKKAQELALSSNPGVEVCGVSVCQVEGLEVVLALWCSVHGDYELDILPVVSSTLEESVSVITAEEVEVVSMSSGHLGLNGYRMPPSLICGTSSLCSALGEDTSVESVIIYGHCGGDCLGSFIGSDIETLLAVHEYCQKASVGSCRAGVGRRARNPPWFDSVVCSLVECATAFSLPARVVKGLVGEDLDISIHLGALESIGGVDQAEDSVRPGRGINAIITISGLSHVSWQLSLEEQAAVYSRVTQCDLYLKSLLGDEGNNRISAGTLQFVVLRAMACEALISYLYFISSRK
eukprot:CAMPEP_0185023266 /NCGR_PEP_ID=MMETSP1103-20130426/5950_1 /TAXON_ID=36769 /ORGANISM="Paraphysomonas bandaiensis, Strain Caron Lab Isolate" /LENGTH=784 /DNA_ID=CAMNT_0027555771 /DNA_START=208 /DNA_END=2562 /DNA_ORIENTATION=+